MTIELHFVQFEAQIKSDLYKHFKVDSVGKLLLDLLEA